MFYTINNRALGTALLFGALVFSDAGKHAHAAGGFPSQPVRIVSCCAGTVDGLARVLGEHMAAATGQPFIVETRPGAAGMIAAAHVMKEKPDGYTLLFGTGQQGANEFLYKEVPYNYRTDFTPLTGIVKNPTGVFVNVSSPYKSLADLIADAKANPGKLTSGWGSTTSRIGSELFKQLAEVDILTVGYKSNPQATMDLIGGRITMTIGDVPTNLPHVAAGKLRALAVTSTERLEQAPGLPTLEESGLNGYDNFGSWIAAWAPANTPRSVVDKLNGLLRDALGSDKAREYFKSTGMIAFPTSPEELDAFQVSEHDRWGEIIAAAGMGKDTQ